VRALAAALVLLCAAPVAAEGVSPEFTLIPGDPVEAQLGAAASASLTISPAAGYSLHKGVGVTIRLSVEPAQGVKLPRRRLSRDDAADPRADAPRFDLPFSGEAAGAYTLRADVRFWVCGKRTCRPARGQVQIPFVIR
jgi:hypothetical protein